MAAQWGGKGAPGRFREGSVGPPLRTHHGATDIPKEPTVRHHRGVHPGVVDPRGGPGGEGGVPLFWEKRRGFRADTSALASSSLALGRAAHAPNAPSLRRQPEREQPPCAGEGALGPVASLRLGTEKKHWGSVLGSWQPPMSALISAAGQEVSGPAQPLHSQVINTA